MFIAVRTGLEPATPCVTGMYSNQAELPHQNFNFRNLRLCNSLAAFPDCECKVNSNFHNTQISTTKIPLKFQVSLISIQNPDV